MAKARPNGATVIQIRRALSQRRETLFFTSSERALLAALESEPVYDKINADYDRGRRVERERMLRLLRAGWNGDETA